VTLLDGHRLTQNGGQDAEALIEEARERQRKRRLWVGSIVLVVAVASGVWAVSDGNSATKPPASSKKPSHVTSPSAPSGTVARNASAVPPWKAPAQFNSVSCSGSTCVAVGESSMNAVGIAKALYSTDGGTHWEISGLPKGLTALDAVECNSPRDCVAIGGMVGRTWPPANVALVTDDAGREWLRVALPAPKQGSLGSLSCGGAEWCVAVGTAGRKALVSRNGGVSWSLSLMPEGATGISCVANGFCLAAGFGSPEVMASTDFGTSWHVVWHAPRTGRDRGVADLGTVDCENSSDCVLSAVTQAPYGFGEMLYTRDGGLRWAFAKGAGGPGGGNSGSGVDSIDCQNIDSCVAIAGYVPNMTGTIVLTSADGGARWRELPDRTLNGLTDGDGVPLSGGVACSASVCIDVGHWSGVWIARTTDGGQVWRAVTLPACATGRCRN
jgi:hypothetical protein